MSRVGLVFDVDGVLIDTSASFFKVVSSAVDIYSRRFLGLDLPYNFFTFEQYKMAKMSPGFNDDYDIAWFFLSWIATTPESFSGGHAPLEENWGFILRSCFEDPLTSAGAIFGKTADRKTVRKICEELYFGEELYTLYCGLVPEYAAGPGAWRNERPLLNRRWDSFDRPVGIYTGRSAPEMALGLRLLGWDGFPEKHCITSCSGVKKPSPDGLFLLERLLGVSEIIFFGDTESDRESFDRYGRGRFIPVGDILAGRPGWFPTINDALAAMGL